MNMNPVYLRRCRSCDVGDDDDVCVPQAADQESREHLIKTHYMSRVSDLTSQLQMCDSKAVHFHAEVSTQTRCSDRIHTSTVKLRHAQLLIDRVGSVDDV